MTRHLPRRQWLLLAPALLASFTARAQRYYENDGDNFFQVIRATYGIDRRNVDVTEQVLRLVARNQQFTASNNTFRTDPAPGKTKTLWLEVQGRNGLRRTFSYREGDTVDGAQFRSAGGGMGGGHGRPQPNHPGWNQIEQATFGNETGVMDVTQRVRQLVQQGSGFPVSPEAMGGDPAYGQTKYLLIRLRGKGGRPLSFKEGAWVEPQQILNDDPR